MVVHDPLGNSLTDSRAVLDHEVKRQSETVITALVGIAPDGVHAAGETVEDGLAVSNDVGLAVGGGDVGDGVAGLAALEVGGTGAKTFGFVKQIDGVKEVGRDVPATLVPEQLEVKRQLPPLVPHEGLVQHLMSVGSSGQYPE